MADFETLKRWVKSDYDFHSNWRDRAREDFDFFHGDQWEEEAKQAMEASNRVPVVFNRVAPIIHAVAGAEINNRTEVKFLPRTMGDAEVNETLSEGARWFRDYAMAEEAESEQFRDVLICGLGWSETTLDFEEDEEGAPKTVRHDPTEIVWDASARRKGLTDAKRVARIMPMEIEEAREMFPGATDEELDASWLNISRDSEEGPTVNHVGDEYAFGDSDVEGGAKDHVHVVQVQWRTKERYVDLIEPTTGQRSRLGKAQFDKMKAQFPAMGLLNHREIVKHVWRQAFIGSKILLKNQPCADHCTFRTVTGVFNRKNKQWYGLLQSMKDPQMWANKFFAQMMRIIDNNSKGGVFVEADAVDPADWQDFEDSYASSDAVHRLKKGGIAKIKEKSGPQFPAAIAQMMEFSISSIRDTSGVNMELLGMRDANQPGVLEYQRRQSAMTTLAGFFDALRYYRKTQGEVILYYLAKYIAPSGRLVRIVKDGQEVYQPMEIGDDTVKYDVIVDDAPSSPNQKEQTWAFIEKLMPVLMNAGISADLWAEIIEHSPLPSSLVEKMRAEIEKGKEPNPEAERVKAIQIAKEESEVRENMASAALDEAKAQQVAIEAQIAPVKAAADFELGQAGLMVKALPSAIPRAGGFA